MSCATASSSGGQPRTRTRSWTRSSARRISSSASPSSSTRDVLGAIAAALEARGRARGAARLFGPVNLLPNQSGGVVTAGFENRGFRRRRVQPPVLRGCVRAERLHAAVRRSDVHRAAAPGRLDAGRARVPVRRRADRARAARDPTGEQEADGRGAGARAHAAERELRAARLLHGDRRGRARVPGGRPRLPDRRANRPLSVQGRQARRVDPLVPPTSRSSCAGRAAI